MLSHYNRIRTPELSNKHKLLIMFMLCLIGGISIFEYFMKSSGKLAKENDDCLANFEEFSDAAAKSMTCPDQNLRRGLKSTSSATTKTKVATNSPTPDKQFADRMNYLLLTFDDLTATAIRPYVDANHPMYDASLNPDWEQFINSAVAFKAATTQTVCAAARFSFLTGLSPEHTKLISFERLLPQANVTNIFEYATKQGYHTFVAGKVFHTHPSTPINKLPADLEYLSGYLSQPRVATQPGNSECNGYMYCYGTAKSSADTNIVRAMDQYFAARAAKPEEPFFAAGGFHRPHLTQKFPKSFLNGLRGDLADYSVPVVEGVTYKKSLAYYDGIESAKYKINFGSSTHPVWQKVVQPPLRTDTDDLFQDKYNNAVIDMRRNYYGSVRFGLYNLGLVIASLKKHPELYSKTVIIVVGDHGWLMGDHQILGKNNLFPEATNVPLLIHYPGLSEPVMFPEIVSTVSLFPTIIEMMNGKKALAQFNSQANRPFDGPSLVPALISQNAKLGDMAITQYPRCEAKGSTQNVDCMTGSQISGSCDLPIIKYMGFTLETSNYMFTAWWPYNDVRTGCSWPSWPGMPAVLQNKIGGIWSQIDPEKSTTVWDATPTELQLYKMQNRKIVSENLAISPTAANQALINNFISTIKAKMH